MLISKDIKRDVKLAFEHKKLLPKALLLVLARLSRQDSLIKRIHAYPLMFGSIHLTENCNSKCITCNQWRKHKTNEMTTHEIKKTLERLKELGCSALEITGGEPLLRGDVGEIINYAKVLGFKRIAMTTNGLLLNHRKEEIVSAGITNIAISLDGIGETHDMIRGVKGNFNETIKAINELNKLRKLNKSFSISIYTTLLKYNAGQIPGIIDLCKGKNIVWQFNLLDASLYFFKDIDFEALSITDHNKIDELMDYIKQEKRRYPDLIQSSEATIEYARRYLKTGSMDLSCYLGILEVCIGSKGEVYSACYAKKPLGNLRESSLKSIMNSKKYGERILQMYKKKCPGCSCGYDSNVRIEELLRLRLIKASENAVGKELSSNR